MDDIFVYRVPLVDKMNEAVMPCIEGYTVYIDSKLDRTHAEQAYIHALTHIDRGDLDSEFCDVGNAEREVHQSV